MKPVITFHSIVTVELSNVRTMTPGERPDGGPAFSTRDLILTDDQGDTFRIGLFGATPEALAFPFDRPPAVRVPDPNDDPAALATETVDA